jgi:Transposase DDE domain
VSGLDAEALVLGGYALFLLGSAAAIDLLARHSHRRAESYRTAGFEYHGHLDAWVCPEGEHLWPEEHDRERRLVRYRARPQVCNACPRKRACTDSDEGREVVRFLDNWPRLEAGRFHRGLAATLVVLAALLAVTALVRHHEPLEVGALTAVLGATAIVGRQFAPALRRS